MVAKILITGGAGQIGSQVVKRFVDSYPEYNVVSLDLKDIEFQRKACSIKDQLNFSAVQGDLTNASFVNELFHQCKFSAVINLAGEHNPIGTLNLLNAGRRVWKDAYFMHRFFHITSDVSPDFTNDVVMDFFNDYGMSVFISNCCEDARPPEVSLPVPVYGKGQATAEWLWVEDQATAIDVLFHQSEAGQYYNIGGITEWYNAELKLIREVGCENLNK
jgi:dTDP-glucose 4,6-dehydratase